MLLLASEYANLPFDYHNQLMYEERCVCVCGSQSDDCLCSVASERQSSIVYFVPIFLAERDRLEKRPLEA